MRRLKRRPPVKDTGDPKHFAHGLNFYKLFWVFFICCFLGVVMETVFVLAVDHRFMSRTGLVWGPFNLVYGIGGLLMTVCCIWFKGKSDRWIFAGGMLIGGGFEYFCSWLQETLTGTVSWDYSEMAFNLNGRINLLYCFFWGILALVWVKELYPRISNWIEGHVPNSIGITLSWVLIVFMLANSFVSGAAVLRMAGRYEGLPAANGFTRWLDQAYPDDKLAKIYPSMMHVDQLDGTAGGEP